MTLQWRDLSTDLKQALRSDFAERVQADALAADAESQSVIHHRRIYAYAKDASSDRDGAVASALRNSARVQRDWDAILEMLGAVDIVTAAAAATSETSPQGKHPDGKWRYVLERSAQPPYEFILIIDIKENCPAPTRLQVTRDRRETVNIDLDPPHRGVIQMMFLPDDDIISALSDADRKVKMW